MGDGGEGDAGGGEEDDMLSVLLSRQPCGPTLTQSNIIEPFISPLKKNNSFLPLLPFFPHPSLPQTPVRPFQPSS